MRIHPVQTGTVRVRPTQPKGKGRGLLRRLNVLRDRRWTEPLPILSWLIEHPEGLILVDTGETARASGQDYFPRWHPYFRHVRIAVSPEEEIGPRLRALGFKPVDVRWVIMTHLHTDHAGGLHHVPSSRILVTEGDFTRALGLVGKIRGYLPHRWPAWFKPDFITLQPEPFESFPQSFRLTAGSDVVIVPTPGHTYAHVSVVVLDTDNTYFLAGDASYTERLMLEGSVDGVTPDEGQAIHTLDRIRQYVRKTGAVYLPSHDPGSVERLRAALRESQAQAAKVGGER